MAKKLHFEITGTGGGCEGYFTKYKNKTFYLTTYGDLTIPEKGQDVSIGMYDSDFEDQYSSDVLKNFDPNLMEAYVKSHLEKYNDLKTKGHVKRNKILYFNN